MQEKEDHVKKSDRTKIYFLSIAIIALLSTNAYFYFKDKRDSKRFITVSAEKDKLELDVEKIEVELDKISTINVTLNDRLLEEQQKARAKIAELKMLLHKNKPTKEELEKAKIEIESLREFVRKYSNQVIILNQENSYLQNEVDSLQKHFNLSSEKANDLEQKNAALNSKIKSNAALKASSISVNAYRVKGRNKPSMVTKASTAEALSVTFSIAYNTIAPKEYHNIYMRVIDPTGNLIADNNNVFIVNNQELQYSHVITIDFKNDDSVFKIDWVNPTTFIKGDYSVILYANGKTMGTKRFTLK